MTTAPARDWQPFLKRIGAYLAAAWITLQAAYLISDIWGLSNWIVQVLFVLLALGLLAAAWHEWPQAPDAGTALAPPVFYKRQGPVLAMAVPTFLLALLYLWPDTRLDASVLHLLQSKDHPYDDSKNAAYLLYGLNAPAGQDPVAYGRHLVETYETTGIVLANPAPLRSTLTLDDIVSLTNGDPPDALFADVDSIPAVLEANRERLQRYRMLHLFPFYTMPVRITSTSPAPPMGEFGDLAYIARREIVYEASRGNAARAWSLWEEEFALHRSLFANTDYLLSKFVMLNTVTELVRLRVLLLAYGLVPGGRQPIARLSAPELSLLPQMRGEFIAGINFLLELDSNPANRFSFGNAFDDFLFAVLPLRTNATLNTYYTEYGIFEAALLPAPALHDLVSTWETPAIALHHYLLNGAGVMILRGDDSTDWHDYMLRIHDFDRQILLSQVAEKLLAEGVRSEYVDGWLTSLDASYFDPFTGARPVWKDGILRYPLEVVQDAARRQGIDLPLPAGAPGDSGAPASAP